MTHHCTTPNCPADRIIKAGTFYRKSDKETIQRYQCLTCRTTFSEATGTPTFGQKKRELNHSIFSLLSSAVSHNRLAKIVRTTRTTVSKKLAFLSGECARRNRELLKSRPVVERVQFDELEAFEHTKCKPLSVALAVEEGTRLILGTQVSSMPANGPLAKISLKKYGKRADHRRQGLCALFRSIDSLCATKLHLLSDKCPRYPSIVNSTLRAKPERDLTYEQTKGARGCLTGQGELKKLGFDPLFSLNHTCAMLRANICRLIRRTWCTTKKAKCLAQHLEVYAYFHNYTISKHVMPILQ